MITRVRIASAAVVLLLATAQSAHSQAPDSTAARAGALPGRGSIGGEIGTPWIISGGDFSQGAQLRFSLSGHFRYVVSPSWRWQVSPYFGWNAYKSTEPAPFADPNYPNDLTKEHYLTQLVGVGSQLQWTSRPGRTRWHLGAGPAVYRVLLENRRKVVADPATFERHHTTHLGASAQLGVERFLKSLPNTSLQATLAFQTAFAADKDKFPSGWNDSPGAVEIRVGGHYYYDLKRQADQAQGKIGAKKK